MKLAVGSSEDVDSDDAAGEVIAACREQLVGRAAKAGLLFSAVDKDYEDILARVHHAFPDIELIGCTTDGEMASDMAFAEDALVLAVLASDRIEVATGYGEGAAEQPVQSAARAVQMAKAKLGQEPSLCIATPGTMTASGAMITRGLREALGDHVPIFGGLAGDQWRFEQTHQFHGLRVLTDSTTILLLAGPILFSHGVASGWTPIGSQGTVTASDGNDVASIDDAPAIEFYRRFLGGHTEPSKEYPVAVFQPDSDDFVLRTAIGHDATTGSIRFSSAIAEGSQVQVTLADRESILAASRASLDRAFESFPGAKPDGALLFSCAARKQILGTRTGEEFGLIDARAGDDLPCAGFYAYGEISPLPGRTQAEYHTETFVSLLLGEAE